MYRTAVPKKVRNFSEERLIAPADPCQTRAVKEARVSRGLVIHGPPGTGKSQTISNIIGDHLARGERVLFVCDKRTALDVVMDRLNAAGLDELCAVVHDPQRDQRELYRSIREQLDQLTELRTNPSAEKDVARMDKELQALHAELTDYHTALMRPPAGEMVSFHEMMGQWLKIPASDATFDDALLTGVSPAQLDEQARLLHEVFVRCVSCGYPKNPWDAAACVSLAKFLPAPIDRYRQTMTACADRAAALDQTASVNIPPFGKEEDVVAVGAAAGDVGAGAAESNGAVRRGDFSEMGSGGRESVATGSGEAAIARAAGGIDQKRTAGRGIVRGDAWHDAYIGAGGGEFESAAGGARGVHPDDGEFLRVSGVWEEKRRGGSAGEVRVAVVARKRGAGT